MMSTGECELAHEMMFVGNPGWCRQFTFQTVGGNSAGRGNEDALVGRLFHMYDLSKFSGVICSSLEKESFRESRGKSIYS